VILTFQESIGKILVFQLVGGHPIAEFCNFLTDNHLEQLVHKSTHIADNILDFICTDLSYKVQSTNLITPGFSDHFMIETVLTGKVERNKKPSSYFTKSNSTDSQLV